MLALLTRLLLAVFQYRALAFSVKSWQSIGTNTDSIQWPENEYDELVIGKTVGMSLSGGGDRSYTASIGYLAAMHELKLMGGVKYIVGVSGGGWATAVYSYFQKNYVSDATMLGPIVFPSDIVYANLSFIEENCVRAFVNSSYRLGGPTYEDWEDAVQVFQRSYLPPKVFVN